MIDYHEPIGLRAAALLRARHICLFYNSQDEEYDILLPFIKEGFEKGDKTFHIIDSKHRPAHLRQLQKVGIDVEGGEKTGQLEVRGWEDAHLRPGHFDQHAMLALVEEVLTKAKQSGYPATRWVANMGWALEDLPGVEDALEYCARLNYVVPNYPATIICTYDLAHFDANMVMNTLRTHPAAIIGGILQENPFFVPPQEMLRELGQ